MPYHIAIGVDDALAGAIDKDFSLPAYMLVISPICAQVPLKVRLAVSLAVRDPGAIASALRDKLLPIAQL